MLTADLDRWIQAFENKCYRRMIDISYREHKTNEYVLQELLLSTVKRRKSSWFGHGCRHDILPEIILQRTMLGVALEDRVNYGGTTSRNRQAS